MKNARMWGDMARGKRPLTGRVQFTHVIGGKLTLCAPWVEDAKRMLYVSIFPDDIKFVREALDALEKGEAEFQSIRGVGKRTIVVGERPKRKPKQKPPEGGVRIIDLGD